jgi:ribosome modulation factor
MIDKKVEKIKKKLRKLHWYQKQELRDWLNAWYSAMRDKEEE